MYDKLLTKKQLSECLDVSISFIDKAIVEGLPKYKFGKCIRFDLQEVLEWFKEKEQFERGE